MGFLSGAVAYTRFRADGPPPRTFGPDHLERLREFQAGRQRVASADGSEAGWAAGGHVLDTAFDLEKNVVADALHFALRVDADRPPADLLKAYYEVELKALAANNPSGFPSAKQKREAKEYARERLEGEAKDGRFKRRKVVPVLWAATTGDVLFGAARSANVGQFFTLFQQTFGVKLAWMTAGELANRITLNGPDDPDDPAGVDAGPTQFIPGAGEYVIPWVRDDWYPEWLGNEFLLWLWFLSDTESDTVKLGDGSEVTFMFRRTLTLECPRGQTGRETFTAEGPTRLPEARRAVQAGKLPRRAGLTVVRHDRQYELTLDAETLAVSGGRLPAPEEENPRAKLEERVNAVRHLGETVDHLYAAFLARRLAPGWAGDLARVRDWLGVTTAGV